ncbi:MAG: energy transducer TonB, partial [Saprospiraceae bacterium]|nr:energy transducer TonB [Saprospiraceae bacterium]
MLIRTAVFLLTIFSFLTVNAQETDTTIYQVMEEMPRFPGCEALDTTAQAKIECAQKQFLAYIYRNVQYPLEARQLGNEGTVAVRFVVEKDGTISQPEILKNVEGGLGEEAVRVISQMDDLGLLWRPGRVEGKAVRAYVTVPVKFRLEEAPPYTMVGRDTVYTVFEKPPAFEGGDSSLQAYLIEQLDYPEVGNDSCLIGNFDVQILIDTRGDVRILNVTDYNDLGFDFWYEAVNAATSTSGNWQPARYEGRAVPAAYDLSLSFYPTDPSCDAVVENYRRAA